MDRELDFVPKHFVIATTPMTDESKIWILEKLIGRFCSAAGGKSFNYRPAFEDPKEALFYELTWG